MKKHKDIKAKNGVNNCSALKEVILPKNLERSYYRFSNCASLSTVVFPENLTTLAARTFTNCPSLTDVTLPATVTNIGNEAFYGCPLAQVAIPAGCTVSCPFVLPADAVSRSAQLYTVDIVEVSGDFVKMKVTANITDTDGTPLPLCAVPKYGNLKTVAIIQPSNAMTDPDSNGMFTLSRQWKADNATHMLDMVYFGYNAAVGSYMAGPQIDANVSTQSFFRTDVSSLSGISAIDAAFNDCPAEYFDLQGRPVNRDNAATGLYIRRQGSTSSKVVIR